MTTHAQPVHDRGAERDLPKRGPNWTFYALTALAIVFVLATYFGFRTAGVIH